MSEQPSHTRRKLPTLFWLALLAVLLCVTLFGVKVVLPAYAKLQAIAKVEQRGGTVEQEPVGPDWLRDWIGEDKMRGFDRVTILWMGSHSNGGAVIGGAGGAGLGAIIGHQIGSTVSVEEVPGQFTAKDFRALVGPELRELSLNGEGFTDEYFVQLPELNDLEELDLAETSITDATLASLGKLPKLTVLDLSGTLVTDAGLKHLGEISSLKKLDLTGTGISDAGMVNLGPLSELWVLLLDNTQVTNKGLKTLQELHAGGALEQLAILWLRGNTGISDSGLLSLSEFEHLSTLCLSGTAVTKTGMARLRRKLPDCDITTEPRELDVGPGGGFF